jgi:hypothetical protein
MKKISVLLLTLALLLVAVAPAFAARPGTGNLYYNGEVVRTIVPPASNPQIGRDNFYVAANGAPGQLGIAAVAPGDTGYHGGKWAFHSVTWNVAPYLLTSEAAVLAAEAAGHVSVTRMPDLDFKCPIQP